MRHDDHCRSCGTRIRWAISAKTGKRMPLDTSPVDNGNIAIVGWTGADPMPTPLIEVNAPAAVSPYRYTSHFATCPDADRFRRRR